MATKKLQRLTSTKQNKPSKNSDLAKAFNAINAKKAPYDILYSYYEGNQPLRYSTERLRKAFDKIGVYFAQNWIAVVVDAVLDRISLHGFDVDEDEKDAPKAKDPANKEKAPRSPVAIKLDEIWEKFNMALLADDVHEAASVTGEAFVIAWKEEVEATESNPEGTNIDIYYNDPRMCHMFYDSYRPTIKDFAAKMWVGKDKKPRIVLYYHDRIEHYISTSQIGNGTLWLGNASSFVADEAYGEGGIESHDMKVVPVFHFKTGRVSKKREIGKSEISLQDAINKLFADMMVASEFSTWTQRVIISQADPGNLPNKAGANWWVPAGDGKGQASNVLELGNKSLENYMKTMDSLSQSLSIISRTPKHYLMLAGGTPSGDALLAMEAPLVKKVGKRIAGYEVEWKNLMQFLLKLEGIEIETSDITAVWEPVETVQPLAEAQTIKTEGEAGIPLLTSVRRRGWDSADIDQLQQDLADKEVKETSIAKQVLNEMRMKSATSGKLPNGKTQLPVEEPVK
jgi:hypothetical protein